MSDANTAAILGGLVDGVVGAVLGFLLAFLLFKLTQRRKNVEYWTSSISLLRLNLQAENTLTIMVKKSLITGNVADDDETEQLNSVYGFQVNLQNTGSEAIENIDDIEIRLDSGAKIVKCETDPVYSDGFKIIAQKDRLAKNVCRLSVPYFNADQSIIVRLISTENENSECKVKVHGVGIKTRQAHYGTFPFFVAIFGGITLLLSGTIIFSVNNKQHVSNPTIVYNIPTIIGLSLIVFSFLIYIYSTFVLFRSISRQRVNRDWDWEIPKAKDNRNFLQRLFS